MFECNQNYHKNSSLCHKLRPERIYKPITAMGFLAMFNFQLQIILKGKHCQRSISLILGAVCQNVERKLNGLDFRSLLSYCYQIDLIISCHAHACSCQMVVCLTCYICICSDKYQLKIASIASQELRALARTLPEPPLLACFSEDSQEELFCTPCISQGSHECCLSAPTHDRKN